LTGTELYEKRFTRENLDALYMQLKPLWKEADPQGRGLPKPQAMAVMESLPLMKDRKEYFVRKVLYALTELGVLVRQDLPANKTVYSWGPSQTATEPAPEPATEPAPALAPAPAVEVPPQQAQPDTLTDVLRKVSALMEAAGLQSIQVEGGVMRYTRVVVVTETFEL
jgi:hypothetical protein